MDNILVIDYSEELTRAATIEGGMVVEVQIEAAKDRRIVGNIYKGRVMRVLPGMNAAFVDVGLDRAGFLYGYDVTGTRVPYHDVQDESAGPQSSISNTDVRIETLLREGQDVLVQVVKEPIGSKGVRLTCNVTLPGVLAVLLPTVEHIGVSRRIDDQEERARLRRIGLSALPPGMGLILRTVAEGRSAEEITAEVKVLNQMWLEIQRGFQVMDAPALLHEEMTLLLRSARDLVCRQLNRLVINSESGLRQVENFVGRFLPSFVDRLELYTGSEPIFERYGIEYELSRAVQRKVWLKSGGSIVIEQTEAFTSVDVNSGKFTGKDDPEETILKTNLEAAEELAYQLRLRNIGGIIVIDFIDMKDPKNRQLVYSKLVEELKRDSARTRVLPMSELGLIEMTRKRVTDSILARLTEPCFYCEGKGYLKSPEMICHSVFAKIAKEAELNRLKELHVHANPKIIKMLLESFRTSLERLEQKHKTTIVLTERETFHLEHYETFGER